MLIAHQLLFHHAGQTLAVAKRVSMTHVCDSSETLNRTAEGFYIGHKGLFGRNSVLIEFMERALLNQLEGNILDSV